MKLRIGLYGYFEPLSWKDVFDGCLTGAQEYEEKEVVLIDDIQGDPESANGGFQHSSRRMWWHGLFCC